MEADSDALPGGASDSWRTWLMTGTRRKPVDHRRVRGAHRGLKKLLVEGTGVWGDQPYTWRDFSGAMVRHSVDEGMRSLPRSERTMVKLAYFGGFSNHEIAVMLGVAEITVQRRLRQAIDAIAEHVERGRVLGRRALYAIGAWLMARRASAITHQWTEVTAAAAAAVIVAVHPMMPAAHPRLPQPLTSPHAAAEAGPAGDLIRGAPAHARATASAPVTVAAPPAPVLDTASSLPALTAPALVVAPLQQVESAAPVPVPKVSAPTLRQSGLRA